MTRAVSEPQASAYCRASLAGRVRACERPRPYCSSPVPRLQSQTEFARWRQLFALRAGDPIKGCAIRLSGYADDGVRACPISARTTSGVVVNLLADFEGVDWSCHPTV
jgi:hypothetical protein